ncbi:MAG: DEAD/DEAH box helicase [Bacteroidota bacterium]
MSKQPFPVESYLKALSIEALNPMQTESLKQNRIHNDCVLLSGTGSGKTLAFLLPVLENLSETETGVQALILAPSRELCLQIEDVFRRMRSEYKVNSSYGGHSVRVEKNNFTQPPAVLIGTPGRIADHIGRGHFDPSTITMLVLDEFDKSLELGFHREMATISEQLHGVKKRILSSATDLDTVPEFVGMTDPVKINFLDGKPRGLTLKTIHAGAAEKMEMLYRLLGNLEAAPTIVFCNHRETVERLSTFLADHGVENSFFHGGMEQDDRERTLAKFRNGSVNILITTDLAARGLDIPEIRFVIHYQLPPKEDAFIHRNGRTARVDASGTAFLVMGSDDDQPDYLSGDEEVLVLSENHPAPSKPGWVTLYIGAGKKDKVNKIDIVGFLSKTGGLERDELGLIEVKDFFSYAAVKRSLVKEVMSKIKEQKIKGKKVKIQQAR